MPDKIYVDARALSYSFCRRVLEKYKDIEQIVLDEDDSGKDLPEGDLSLTKGKRTLYLKYFKGNAFKLCPGFSDAVLCCNYYVIDLVENCPLECSYCILQAFLNKPVITFHVNVEEIVEKMVSTVRSRPLQGFRIGTGEHSDSLALDSVFQVNAYLIEVFANLSNATLELKTKTDDIDSLVGLNHKGRTVIAWSLNPREIIRTNEFKTASLENRLKSATRLEKDGYKIAFHFDPIVFYSQWQLGYKQTIDMMFAAVSPENIAWISLGTLRFIPVLKQIAESRFPGISLFCSEFIAGEDGKTRYLKSIRKELLRTLAGWITKAAPQIPLYLCMEKHSLWRHAMPVHPLNSTELESYLNLNV